MQVRDWSTVEELGKIPDTHVAARLGVGVKAVRNARHRLGIPAFVPVKAESCDFDTELIKKAKKADDAQHRKERAAIAAKAEIAARAEREAQLDEVRFSKIDPPERAIFIAMQRLLKRALVSLRTYGASHAGLCEDIANVMAAADKVMAILEGRDSSDKLIVKPRIELKKLTAV